MPAAGPAPGPGSSPTGLAARLGALYAVAFAGIGVSTPFLPVWIAGRGFDPGLVGVLLSVPILARIALSAPLMSLADRRRTESGAGAGAGAGPRGLLVAGHAVAAATYAGMAWVAAPLPLAALLAVNAVAAVPLVATADFLALDAVRRDPGRLAYGRIRVWGSLAYLAANVGAGALLARVGAGSGTESGAANAVVLLLAGLSTLGAVVAWLATPRQTPAPASAPSVVREPEPVTEPVTEPGAAAPSGPTPGVLRLAILAAAVLQAAHAAVYGFGSLRWRAAGLTDDAIGLLWAVGVAAEVALFALADRVRPLARLGPFGWIGLGGAAALARWLALAVAEAPLALGAIQGLHGLTFGATQLGVMAALARYAPAGRRGRAQGHYSAASALAMAGTTVLAGAAYRSGGGTLAFLAMEPVTLAGLVLAALAARAARRPTAAGTR